MATASRTAKCGSRARASIRDGLEKLGLAEPNPKVLAEVVHLAEWPTVLEGRFDERFLSLPRRVVETAMESHQRYFPLAANRFAFVDNGGDPATVIAGNEGVLEGRLEDASFTFERDVAKGIERLVEESTRITFVAGAGTYGDKVARLQVLVVKLHGSPRPIRLPSSFGSFRTSRATSVRSTRAWRASRRRSAQL